MQRLYYLCNNKESSDNICQDIAAIAQGDWRIHLIRQNEAGKQLHVFISSTELRKQNIVHSGERGAKIGFAAGGAAAFASYLFSPMLSTGGPLIFSAAICVCVLAAAWAAGTFGIEEENYKIRRFTDELQKGKTLFILDIGLEEIPNIQKQLAQLADVRPVTDHAIASSDS